MFLVRFVELCEMVRLVFSVVMFSVLWVIVFMCFFMLSRVSGVIVSNWLCSCLMVVLSVVVLGVRWLRKLFCSIVVVLSVL